MTSSTVAPEFIGSYRIVRELGRGGMGIVYLAEDMQLSRSVAIKVMDPELAKNQDARARFLREARSMAALRHENVVTLYGVGPENEQPYFVMEFLEGESLHQRLKSDQPLLLREVLDIAIQLLEGLGAAHRKGLVHRDIKPSNVFLDGPERKVKLLDFGLAREVDPNIELTRTGDLIGSPQYMAPEQAAGETIDHRADLFSFGTVLYQLTTGKLPFAGSTTYSVLMAIGNRVPPSPVIVNAHVPSRLSNLIDQLLQKNPSNRPQNVDVVLSELRAIRNQPGIDNIRPMINENASQPTTQDPRVEATGAWIQNPPRIPPDKSETDVPTPVVAIESQTIQEQRSSTRFPNRNRKIFILVASIFLLGGMIYILIPDRENADSLAQEMIAATMAGDMERAKRISLRSERLSPADQLRYQQLVYQATFSHAGNLFQGMTKTLTNSMKDLMNGIPFEMPFTDNKLEP